MNQQQQPGSKFIADKVIAVALVIWLLFGGGLTQIKTWLTPARINQVAQAVDTIKTGAGRITSGAPAAPAARPAAPGAPRTNNPAAPAAPAETQAQIDAQADAEYQAAVQAANAAAVVAPMGIATAVVSIPTIAPIAQITVVPDPGKPIVYAQSAPIGPTIAPTLPIPTPLADGDLNMILSPDGKCVSATRRGSGQRYQACQDWAYNDHEAKSIAEMLYTGSIPGVAVP